MMQIFYSEAERLSSVVDRILSDDRPFYAGAFSIADIMLYPWLVHGIRMNFPAMMSTPKATLAFTFKNTPLDTKMELTRHMFAISFLQGRENLTLRSVKQR